MSLFSECFGQEIFGASFGARFIEKQPRSSLGGGAFASRSNFDGVVGRVFGEGTLGGTSRAKFLEIEEKKQLAQINKNNSNHFTQLTNSIVNIWVWTRLAVQKGGSRKSCRARG